VAADQLALSFQKSFGTPVAVLRPFNTYGPRQSARAVIPTIISQIAAGERKIKLGALSPTRDFTFVHDTAQGFIKAMECDACVGEATNIGSDFEISIKDTVALIAEVMGVEIEIVSDEERMRPADSEVERLYAGVDKARRLFGWAPEHGGRDGFAKGIAKTAEWFQDPTNLAAYKTGQYNV
jgi:dTDP-glucose 4,6-dehydratase